MLPRRLVSALRLVAVFQGALGHTRTTADGLIVDGSGDYIPWLTYPAIEFLRGLDYSGCRVFEFGAGASTLFWAKRAREVVSVELDPAWFERLRGRVPANVRLMHDPDPRRYAETLGHEPGTFDVILVDGAERFRCARAALARIAPGGMIVLDNADWYPRTADLLAGAGLIETRYSGFSPLNAFTSTTAIYLARDFARPLATGARKPPAGAKILPAPPPDDGA